MKFISAQPATLYYAWQVEVMLYNFKKNGIYLRDVDIVCAVYGAIPKEWVKLTENYEANFCFYRDTRKSKKYISSIRPNILKQHFATFQNLKNEVIFYHDCDIIFSQPLNTIQFENDNIWYGSNTNAYINYDYIISKGQDVFDRMVKIVNIDPHLIIDNNNNSIGAQYIMKNIDEEFWQNVEINSENLFIQISEMNKLKKANNPKYHELQIWCADMWAVLWNAWKRGYTTKCHKDLEFSWATSNEKDYLNRNIFHNAGVVSSKDGLFYKSDYMHKLPYNLNLNIKPNTASKKYYEWIQMVEKESPLI